MRENGVFLTPVKYTLPCVLTLKKTRSKKLVSELCCSSISFSYNGNLNLKFESQLAMHFTL